MFVWDEAIPSPLVNAASWRIAAELVSAVPEARVYELHPGGGQYDVLAVWTSDESVKLDVNRNGSLHVHQAPRAAAPWPGERLWPAAIRPGGAERIALEVLGAAGLIGKARNRSGIGWSLR